MRLGAVGLGTVGFGLVWCDAVRSGLADNINREDLWLR